MGTISQRRWGLIETGEKTMTHIIFAKLKKKLTKWFTSDFYDGLPDMGGYWLSDKKLTKKHKSCLNADFEEDKEDNVLSCKK